MTTIVGPDFTYTWDATYSVRDDLGRETGSFTIDTDQAQEAFEEALENGLDSQDALLGVILLELPTSLLHARVRLEDGEEVFLTEAVRRDIEEGFYNPLEGFERPVIEEA